MLLRVECYAGYRGEETPRRVYFGDRPIDVDEILDRWIGQDHRYFKLRGSDGVVYILRHDEGRGDWELTMYGHRD
ncbi:MAG: hypothetical protein QNJ94_09170 [Alphaproteobacteria bacterium]|nr:hypothetical protein [Alphaproteobacteria bacterium]